MKQKEVRNVRICGIQCAVPRKIISNEFFLSDFTQEEINKSVALTGVKERRFAESNTCTSDLCIASAKKLMKDLGWNPDTVDGLIYVTQTPDYRIPATSCVIQEELGIPTECVAFDVNLGCSGYIYGLWMASNFVANGCLKRTLLLVGDTLSKTISPQDRSTVMLFGDAGTATAIEFDKETPTMSFVLGTDGTGKNNLIIPSGGFRSPSTPETTARTPLPGGGASSREDLYMDGGEIFNFTIRRVPPLVKTLLELAETEITNIDYFVFHQANEFIMKHLAKKLKLAPDQVPMSIGEYGNTSSASIPLTIARNLRPELMQDDKTVALVGFGVGYSWGGALVKMGPLRSLSIMEV